MADEAREARFRQWIVKSPVVVAPLLLISAAIVHAVAPQKLGMDWQSVALLVFGVVLIFLPMRDIAVMIKSLELGKVKILMKDTNALDETTAKAEVEVAQEKDLSQLIEPEVDSQAEEDGGEERDVGDDDSAGEDESDERASEGGDGENLHRRSGKQRISSWTPHRIRGPWNEPELEFKSRYEPFWRIAGEVAQIAEVNPKAGLVRLAISIESTVVTLATDSKLAPPQSSMSFRQAVMLLEQAKVIPRHLSEGLVQFMDLRNKIVHLHLRERVEDDVVTSATRNGMTLLSILLNIASRYNEDPLSGETISLV
jgi:uncharacterized protein YutE (UPF0331/DUF86 family)